MDNCLDFGTPISFGYTAQYLDRKTQTRREWKDSHAAKFCNAYDRAAAAGQQLRVPAIDKAYHAGGKQIGWCLINCRPCKQRLWDMDLSNADLMAEGGMCRSVADFIRQYFPLPKSAVNLGFEEDLREVWVIQFQFTALPDTDLKFVPVEERPLYQMLQARRVEAAREIEIIKQSELIPVTSSTDFIDRQVSQIASHGDRARWQIPEHECEGCDGSDDDAPVMPVKSCCIPCQQPKPFTQFLEFDPEYDTNYNRELAFKRYLRLIESPFYRVDLAIDRFAGIEHLPPEQEQRGPKPKIPIEKDLPFPPNLDTSGRKIGWGMRKKILAALAIWPLPRDEVVNVRTLFAEVKFRGFKFDQKTYTWNYQYRARWPIKSLGSVVDPPRHSSTLSGAMIWTF